MSSAVFVGWGDGIVSDRRGILQMVERLQERIGEFYEELSALRLQLADLIEENQRLRVENANLRNRANLDSGGSSPPAAEAAIYLGQLYEDGFHVCNIHYGSLRKGECLFCMQNLQRT